MSHLDLEFGPPNNALQRTAALSSCRLLVLRGQFFGVQAARRTRGFHPAQYLAAERGVRRTKIMNKITALFFIINLATPSFISADINSGKNIMIGVDQRISKDLYDIWLNLGYKKSKEIKEKYLFSVKYDFGLSYRKFGTISGNNSGYDIESKISIGPNLEIWALRNLFLPLGLNLGSAIGKRYPKYSTQSNYNKNWIQYEFISIEYGVGYRIKNVKMMIGGNLKFGIYGIPKETNSYLKTEIGILL